MQRTLLIGYAVLAALALLLIVWAIPVFTPHYAGYGMHPAALPYMLAGLLCLCALTCVAQLRRRLRVEPDTTPTPLPLKRWVHLGVYAVVLLLAMPLMARVGFFVGSVVLLAVLQWMAGQRNWVVLASVALGVGGGTWAVLWYGLQAPLP